MKEKKKKTEREAYPVLESVDRTNPAKGPWIPAAFRKRGRMVVRFEEERMMETLRWGNRGHVNLKLAQLLLIKKGGHL